MGPAEAAPADPTARARIRDAALREFARHGVGGATIRGIAAAAGVSPGLVQHHFGSKEELREACDRHAFETFRSTRQEALAGGLDDPGFLTAILRTARPVQQYVARCLVDGSPAAAALFDEMAHFSEEYLGRGAPGLAKANTTDLPAYAAVVTAMNLSIVVFHEHLARLLGADPLTHQGYPRVGLALLDIHADVLLSPELTAKARAGLAEMGARRFPASEAAARKTDSDPPR